jgi:hypothetical protein
VPRINVFCGFPFFPAAHCCCFRVVLRGEIFKNSTATMIQVAIVVKEASSEMKSHRAVCF